jgi:polysaccharide pyruvyl transferase WcaK-like protein
MRDKSIVFLGTHGQYNIGDELLLETFLTRLGSENRYFVNSYDPAFTTKQLGEHFRVEVFHTAKERGPFLRHLLACDLLFFGGGSIIKELYGTVGRNRYATLLMVLATVTFTHVLARKPIVMSNIGVGPIATPWGRRLARLILRQVDVLSVRDDNSYRTCLQLGLAPGRVQRVPDAVFANPPAMFLSATSEVNGRARPGAAFQREPMQVALNLNYDIENPDNWETFQANLADALTALHTRRPLVIHGLPMQSRGKVENDWKVLADFRERIPGLEMQLHRPETHQEVARIIASCDLLLAERLHALVIAAILGLPCFALVYDVKVRELVANLDMQQYSVDVNHPFDPGDLVRRVDTLLNHADDARSLLLARSTAFREELDCYFADLERMWA